MCLVILIESAKPCGQQWGWSLSTIFLTRGASGTLGLEGKGMVFGEELGHSQVLGCLRERQGEGEQELMEVGEEGSIWDGLVPGSRKLPREGRVVLSCLATSTLSFSLQGGAAFSSASWPFFYAHCKGTPRPDRKGEGLGHLQ